MHPYVPTSGVPWQDRIARIDPDTGVVVSAGLSVGQTMKPLQYA